MTTLSPLFCQGEGPAKPASTEWMVNQRRLIVQADLPAFVAREMVKDILGGVMLGLDHDRLEAMGNGGVILHIAQDLLPGDRGVPSIERVLLCRDSNMLAVSRSFSNCNVPRMGVGNSAPTRRDNKTGHQTFEVPLERRQRGLIEIVDVE